MKPKMMIGTFVFRFEGDGCLTSKYLNQGQATPYVEACKLKEAPSDIDNFSGRFDTVWIEENNKCVCAELSIIKKTSDSYELIWYKLNQPESILFNGIGMLYDNLLVGSYWEI